MRLSITFKMSIFPRPQLPKDKLTSLAVREQVVCNFQDVIWRQTVPSSMALLWRRPARDIQPWG
jgi:hypothetical protein